MGLHRSLSFWSGVLVVLYVIWAWLDSVETHNLAIAGRWEFSSRDSALAVKHELSWSNYHFSRNPIPGHEIGLGYQLGEDPGSLRIVSETTHPNVRRIRMALPGFLYLDPDDLDGLLRQLDQDGLDRELRRSGMGAIGGYGMPIGSVPPGWVLLVPYWLILLAVLVVWSGLLLWRARRIRKAKMLQP